MTGSVPRDVDALIVDAFRSTHDGYSTDAVLADDQLLAAFQASVRARAPSIAPPAAMWRLLNLRKAKKLTVATVRRTHTRADHYAFASEIAARRIEDEAGITLDRALCDPVWRARFDAYAADYAPAISARDLRLAALGLRKARRLSPENLKRIGATPTVVAGLRLDEVIANPLLVPGLPGIYGFSDTKDGVLYVGESENLRTRVAKHIDHSDRKALARHFWANGYETGRLDLYTFPTCREVASKRFRTAYQAYLTRSRRPKFNIQGQADEDDPDSE